MKTTSDWHAVSPTTLISLPPEVQDWVNLQTSMTARIGEVAGTAIDVEVLRQANAGLLSDEQAFFPEDDSAGAVVREVCLSSNQQPLLIARTSFTSKRLEEHPTVKELGNRALGSLLFANGPPNFTAREYVEIRSGAPLWDLVLQRHAPAADFYWARRTLFELFEEPLLVTEIFMPELLNLAKTQG